MTVDLRDEKGVEEEGAGGKTLGCTETLLTEETLHTDPASEQWWWLLPPRLQIPNSKTIPAPAATAQLQRSCTGLFSAASPRPSLIGQILASPGAQPTRGGEL